MLKKLELEDYEVNLKIEVMELEIDLMKKLRHINGLVLKSNLQIELEERLKKLKQKKFIKMVIFFYFKTVYSNQIIIKI